MKKIFKILSGIIGVTTFIPLIFYLLHGGSSASFATFLFWTIIVGINALVTIKEKGNYLLPLILTFGNLATSITLLIVGQVGWGWVEWLTFVMVLVCIYAWLSSGNLQAMIASTIAITIGGIPQIILAWNQPTRISLPIWSSFLVASMLSVLAGKEWSLKERFYGMARTIFYALIIVISLKKFL